ncbi:ADAMTS10 [Symbiodinium sp. CCMP2592]|nr:ADAMTS10 [Symbiodinium sp. CCMP2592]
MDDLQKPKNVCPWCQVSYFGTYCTRCSRCSCGYYSYQGVRCGHFGHGCQRCGATTFQQGTFCESCGYCVHGRQQSTRKPKDKLGWGCDCQTSKKAKTCKETLASDQNKLDPQAASRAQLTELAHMADTLAKLCRKDAKAMETAEKEFQKKMVLLKEFAEAINDVPKVLRCFLLFRCGAIKEDPTSLKEWLSKAEVEEVHRQLEEFRDEAGEEKIARRFGKSRTVSEGSWSVMTDRQGVVR